MANDTSLPPPPTDRPTVPCAPVPYAVICEQARQRLLAEWREAELLLDEEAEP